MVEYIYSITDDTLNGVLLSFALHKEILLSELGGLFVGLQISGDVLKTLFLSSLTAGQITTLTNLIGAHTGEPPTEEGQEHETPPDESIDGYSGFSVGNIVVSQGEAYILVDDTFGAAVWKPITKSPRIYYFNEKYSPFTHTSSCWQNAHNWTTPSVPTGRYRIGWSYLWSGDDPNRNFEAQILVNGTRVMLHQQEPQETGGYNEPITPNAGTDQGHWCSGFVFIDLDDGSHSIKLQTRIETGSNECSIHRNVFEIEKVGDQSSLDPSQNLTDRSEHDDDDDD